MGPDLPPDLLALRKRKRSNDASKADKQQDMQSSSKVTHLPHSPTVKNNDRDKEDSEDEEGDCGPQLPGQEDDRYSRRPPKTSDLSAVSAEGQKQRAEWMTLPPRIDDWKQNIDTTKLKSRTFAPARRGASQISSSSLTDRELSSATKRAEAGNAQDAETIGPRAKSLYDQHNERRREAAPAEDSPSQRPFDREKDIGSSISYKKSRQIATESQGLSSKFETSKFT